jgi:hypothetical protein
MLQTPFFRVLATITILLGCVAAGVYSAPHLALVPRLPDGDPARLVIGFQRLPFSPPREGPPVLDFSYWKNEARSFDGLAAFHLQKFYLADPSGETERIQGGRVSSDFFSVLGVKPALGRAFLPEDAAAKRRLVVLSDRFWKKKMGASPKAAGRIMVLDGIEHEVVGVMSADFWFLSRQVEFWVLLPSRPNYFVSAVGRLKPGIEARQAQDEVRRLESAGGGQPAVRLLALKDLAAAPARMTRWAFPRALALVMLIALVYVLPLLRSNDPPGMRTGAAFRVWSFVLLKALAGFLAVAALWLVMAGRLAPPEVEFGSYEGLFVPAWLFLLAACGVVGWALLDQNSRCPRCLHRLRMPLQTGSWSSLVVNRPGTELICPFGHGKLYVPGTNLLGPASTRWTSYHDMWQELFSESPQA